MSNIEDWNVAERNIDNLYFNVCPEIGSLKIYKDGIFNKINL